MLLKHFDFEVKPFENIRVILIQPLLFYQGYVMTFLWVELYK